MMLLISLIRLFLTLFLMRFNSEHLGSAKQMTFSGDIFPQFASRSKLVNYVCSMTNLPIISPSGNLSRKCVNSFNYTQNLQF